jgi:hypothetical protein
MNKVNWGLYDDEDVRQTPTVSKKELNQKPKLAQKVNWDLYDAPSVSEPETKEKTEIDRTEILKDIGQQGIKETLIGLGGTYGDLAELAGIPKGQTEGSKARSNAEFETLERMEQPGYKPSFSDIYSLNSDDEVAPLISGFTSSSDLRDANELLGGPGEAKTEEGRYAGRIGKFAGSSLAFGQGNLVPAVAAGITGQLIEEQGGGPLLQVAGEVASILVTQGRGGKPNLNASSKKEVQEKINSLRKLGYSEEDITLAVNSASQGKVGGLRATKGEKTIQAFEDFSERSGEMVDDILTSGIKGYEKGASHVHEMASDAYGEVVKRAEGLKLTNLDPFLDAMDKNINRIKKVVGNEEEANKFIKTLSKDSLDVIDNPTAENMINFYKRLNNMGKWVGRNAKDKILTDIKDSIKTTFKAQGAKGNELAQDFEKVNAGIRKAYLADDVRNIIQKASSQEGIDYKKLYKSFDKSDNIKLFEEILGKKQTDNLRLISKTGKEIKDFDKSWKATNTLTGSMTEALRGAGLGYFLFKGDLQGLASVFATKGLSVGSRKMAEKLLTDPKLQNITVRGLHAIKNESPKLFKPVEEALNKYLEEENID